MMNWKKKTLMALLALLLTLEMLLPSAALAAGVGSPVNAPVGNDGWLVPVLFSDGDVNDKDINELCLGINAGTKKVFRHPGLPGMLGCGVSDV